MWSEDVNDYKAIQQARLFKGDKEIKWDQQLANIAIAFEKESSPCNSRLNKKGQQFEQFVRAHVDRFEMIYVVSYEGEYTFHPEDIIISLLKKGRIDPDLYEGKYDKMGVACECNKEFGMECALIFAAKVSYRPADYLSSEYSDVENIKLECEKKCNN